MDKIYRSHHWNEFHKLGRKIAFEMAEYQTAKLPGALSKSDFTNAAATIQAACLFDYDRYMMLHGYEPDNQEWLIEFRHHLCSEAEKLEYFIRIIA